MDCPRIHQKYNMAKECGKTCSDSNKLDHVSRGFHLSVRCQCYPESDSSNESQI